MTINHVNQTNTWGKTIFFGETVLDFLLQEAYRMIQATKSKGSSPNKALLMVRCCWFASTIELHIVTSIVNFAMVPIGSLPKP
jgi:hypothetical protein